MEIQEFWQLIEQARQRQVGSRAGSAEATALAVSALLTRRSTEEIVGAQQSLWALMAESYRSPLWAAAYLVNGGCSDDGFDYFRGWLILQGQQAFERAVADPETLAELPEVRAAAAVGEEIEAEEALSVAWNAYRAVTGEEIPAGTFSVRYPELDQAWNFDFDDKEEMRRRLPKLTALYWA